MGLLDRARLTDAGSASTVAALVASTMLTMAVAVPMAVQAVQSGDAVGITDGSPIRADDARFPDPASVVAAIAGDEGESPG